MVKTPPKKVFWGGFGGVKPLGATWTLRDCIFWTTSHPKTLAEEHHDHQRGTVPRGVGGHGLPGTTRRRQRRESSARADVEPLDAVENELEQQEVNNTQQMCQKTNTPWY